MKENVVQGIRINLHIVQTERDYLQTESSVCDNITWSKKPCHEKTRE